MHACAHVLIAVIHKWRLRERSRKGSLKFLSSRAKTLTIRTLRAPLVAGARARRLLCARWRLAMLLALYSRRRRVCRRQRKRRHASVCVRARIIAKRVGKVGTSRNFQTSKVQLFGFWNFANAKFQNKNITIFCKIHFNFETVWWQGVVL